MTVLLSFSSTAIRHPPLPTTISLIYNLSNCLGCAVVVGARESPIDLRVDLMQFFIFISADETAEIAATSARVREPPLK